MSNPSGPCRYVTDSVRIFRSHLPHEPVEVLQALYFGQNGILLAHRIHSFGSADETWMSICSMLSQASDVGALAILLAHNHPNGVAVPSVQDCRSTIRLAQEAARRGIEVVDHLILTEHEHCSIRARVAAEPI